MCYWPLVCELCTNHEVVMLQPCTVTNQKPRLCRLFLHSLILKPPHPLILSFDVLPGGASHSWRSSPSTNVGSIAAWDHSLTRASPVNKFMFGCYNYYTAIFSNVFISCVMLLTIKLKTRVKVYTFSLGYPSKRAQTMIVGKPTIDV